MKIIKIKKLKNNTYKILFEDDFIVVYDELILKYNLLYKKEIDDELFNKLKLENDFYKVYNDTLKYCLKKVRSKREINEYLIKQNINKDQIKTIINKLENINVINDYKFCLAFINDRTYLSNDGINKIKIDLEKENIDKYIIEEEIKKIDIDYINKKMEKLILKKINSNTKYSNNYLKNKIVNEMINLGYEKNNIIDILDNNLKNDNSILEKEFNKIYNKLNKKYEGSELNKRVEQKLYSKGFNISEIKKMIEKKY